MWRRATLTSAKFTAHSWRSATGRAADSEYSFGSDFFHGRRVAPTRVEGCSIVTTSRFIGKKKGRPRAMDDPEFAYRRCSYLTFRRRMSPSGEYCIPPWIVGKRLFAAVASRIARRSGTNFIKSCGSRYKTMCRMRLFHVGNAVPDDPPRSTGNIYSLVDETDSPKRVVGKAHLEALSIGFDPKC
jgi:hypothetical protein